MLKSVYNYLHHMFGDNPERWRPLLSVYYLTYSCNFRCPYCSDGNKDPYYELPSPRVTGERALEILAAVRRSCEFVVITGGEPLLHGDFERVMTGLGALKFQGVTLTTNGHCIEPQLPLIARAVDDLVFSLDTLDHARADGWYGVGDGALESILGNIELARTFKKRKYGISISSVVTPDNIQDLYEVYDYARTRGFQFAACPQLVGVKAHERLRTDPEYRKLYDFLLAEKKRGGKIFGTPLYLEYMRDLKKFDCRPFTMLVVSPTGEIYYPCLEQGRHAANILEVADLNLVRRQAQERFGRAPECDNRCHSACALTFGLLLGRPTSAFGELAARVRGVLRKPIRRHVGMPAKR